MIGVEFASRVGPLAGLRTLGPFDDMTCDVCGAPHAVCTGTVVEEPEPVNVEALVAERAAQQTRRPPGRPPTDPVKRAAYDARVAAAEQPDAVVDVTATGHETIDAAGLPAPEPGPDPAAIPAGDPTEVRDLYVVPDGVTDPADDPHRPDPNTTVIVGDRSQLYDTGAWMTLPGGDTVATTREVVQVHWPLGCIDPQYKKVAGLGKQLAHPRLVT